MLYILLIASAMGAYLLERWLERRKEDLLRIVPGTCATLLILVILVTVNGWLPLALGFFYIEPSMWLYAITLAVLLYALIVNAYKVLENVVSLSHQFQDVEAELKEYRAEEEKKRNETARIDLKNRDK